MSVGRQAVEDEKEDEEIQTTIKKKKKIGMMMIKTNFKTKTKNCIYSGRGEGEKFEENEWRKRRVAGRRKFPSNCFVLLFSNTIK